MSEEKSGKRGTGPNALRRGRFSQPGGDYFVTVCVEPRLPLLAGDVAVEVLSETRNIASEGHWLLRCMSVMPDHVHLLVRLGEGLTLSQAIARLKVKTRSGLRSKRADWQTNFYDHRIREEDKVEDVIRYIHLNPYRRGLIRESEAWPYFHCEANDWDWYERLTDNGSPFPEWLK